jgi:p-aminobenzoyl-glutamate transporter AbgT
MIDQLVKLLAISPDEMAHHICMGFLMEKVLAIFYWSSTGKMPSHFNF